MEENARFKVVLSKEARLFLKGLSSKISDKITYNIRKATSVIDPVLFKKLDDTDIWEFRTQYGGIQYRLLAFWDKVNGNGYIGHSHPWFYQENAENSTQRNSES